MKGYICGKSRYKDMSAPTLLPSAELSADKDIAKQNKLAAVTETNACLYQICVYMKSVFISNLMFNQIWLC